MAKRQPVVLPDYPQILLTPRRGGGSWDGKHIDDCFDALADHYRLKCRFSDLPSHIGVLPDKETKFWMGLAWGLVRDFVPAFGKEKPKVGTPKQIHTQVDGVFPHAHEARLVQIVGALRRMLTDRELPSTKTAAYNQVLRILKVSPAPLWRYGKYRKVSAFQQAWKSIPKDVRDKPNSYFPLHLPQWDFPKKLHLEVVMLEEGDPSPRCNTWPRISSASPWSAFSKSCRLCPRSCRSSRTRRSSATDFPTVVECRSLFDYR
jgi:hypothetical protein